MTNFRRPSAFSSNILHILVSYLETDRQTDRPTEIVMSFLYHIFKKSVDNFETALGTKCFVEIP